VRVLFLTKYSSTGPSSRYRVVQFLPFLTARGIEWDLHALHDDRYLEGRFSGRRASPLYLARRVASRLGALARARRYDLVFIQKEVFPHVLDVPEWILSRLGVRYVVDIDDAIHLFYDGARGWRRALREKIPRVLAGANAVLAGNRYLEAYAGRYCPHAIHFPTVVDTDRFRPALERAAHSRPVVGWIGTPETARYLHALSPALEAASQRTSLALRVVGAGAVAVRGVPVEAKPWREAEEVDDLQAMDIGVMPLADDEWSKGKCSLKLLQYMSAGVPAVASALGSAPDIVVDGDNGFLARDNDEWRDRIVSLATSESLRRSFAERGRRTVERDYSLAVWGPRFAEVLVASAQGRAVPDHGARAVGRA
jgi:glycosyltransferase involved in cell wall biosynthesis